MAEHRKHVMYFLRVGVFDVNEHRQNLAKYRGPFEESEINGHILFTSLDPKKAMHAMHAMLQPEAGLPSGHAWLLVCDNLRELKRIAENG